MHLARVILEIKEAANTAGAGIESAMGRAKASAVDAAAAIRAAAATSPYVPGFDTTSLDLSGNKNAATKAASDASTASLRAFNRAQTIDDSTRVDLETRYKAGTLTAADLATAKANAEAQKNNYTNVTRSLGTAVDPIGRQDALAATRIAESVLAKVTELANAAAQPAGTIGGKAKAPAAAPAVAAPPPAPAPAPAPTVAPAAAPAQQATSASTTHVVTINLNGQTTSFATATASDAQRAIAFLQTLESSARSAGYGG